MIARLHCMLLAGAAATLPATVLAQDAAGGPGQAGIEAAGDIVVTARRKDERLQDAPLAITVFSGESLERKSIFNISEVGRLAPNVSISSGRGGGSVGYIFIRGIGQADDNPSMDPGVSQYVDDVYLGRIQGGLINLDDVRSIEVLRGPQGTLYGKNTIGGAVKISSVLPGNDPAYRFEAGYGNYGHVSIGGAVSQPVVDDLLSIRLSGKYTRNDGFMRNAFDGERMNNVNTLTGRLLVRLTPGPDFEALLSVDGTRDRSRPWQGRIVGTEATAVFNAVNAVIGPIGSYAVSSGGRAYDGSFDVRDDPNLPFSRSKENSWGSSLRLSWTSGAVTAKSITSYRELKSHVLKDVDSSPLRVANVADALDQWQFSQEFQLANGPGAGRFTWLAGLFYYKEKLGFDTTADLVPALIPLGVNQQSFRQTRFGTQSYAAFLNLGYELAPGLNLSLGARYTHEKKDFDVLVRRLSDQAVTFGPVGNKASFDDFSPKIEIDYRWSPDMMTYASVAKGFKSGGFNGRAGVGAQLEAFQPEKAWTYELGLKSSWLDRRLTFNLAAFYTDYKDIQFQVISAVNGQLLQLVTNAGKGHMKGIEAEASFTPVAGFDISGTLGLIDADFTEFFDARLGDLSANKFQNTPGVTASIAARYEAALGSDAKGALAVDYSYRSKTYYDPQNTEAFAQPGYGLINARASLFLSDERIEIAAYAKNLTDKRYIQNGASLLDSFGLAIGYFGAPRTYGLQLIARY